MKATLDGIRIVVRDGNWITEFDSSLYCPEINSCKTYKTKGIKATICCCQKQDFCNTASTNSFKPWVLLFNTVSIYIFMHMY